MHIYIQVNKTIQIIYIHLIVQNFDGGNIDRLAAFRCLTGKLLTDSLRQPVFAMQFERENFNRSLAKHQIRQYSPDKILRYTILYCFDGKC